MANPEHVEIALSGAKGIEEWRRTHSGEVFDLTGADLANADLAKADLRGANLRGADLFGADLSEAKLTKANLTKALLFTAFLWKADLARANLSQARITAGNLNDATLSGANLSESQLVCTDFTLANLTRSNLARVDLTGANFNCADLTATNFTSAIMSGTAFSDCNLTECKGLGTVNHQTRSSIGIDTLIQSFRSAGNRVTPELTVFFQNAGVPSEVLQTLPKIAAEIQYCTCFVAFGAPDKAFAEKLVRDLKSRGVSSWLYSMDATPGQRTWGEITQKRREAEKMIVICSAQALVRDGVLKEIEEQIDEDPDKLVPISLDNMWKEPGFRVMRGQRDLKPFLLERNYADFSDPSTYDEALDKLLTGLKRQD